MINFLLDMHVTTYNGFKGFYVATKSDQAFDGLKLHYWAETVEECKKWIDDYENRNYNPSGRNDDYTKTTIPQADRYHQHPSSL